MTRPAYRALILLAHVLAPMDMLLAYERETHREITHEAIRGSLVDEFLRRELLLPSGIREVLRDREIRQVAGDGAFDEDEPVTRVVNHFHDPLRPWESAGLRVLLQIGQSSILWQQAPVQDGLLGGGNWAWQHARRHYFTALTARTSGERQEAFARTFFALGHLMHMVQDASVPAHVRNDPHLLRDGYEQWVEAIRASTDPGRRALFTSLLEQPPVRPAPAIFTRTDSARAPVPVARLIDRDLFAGTDATGLLGAVAGVAEYTSGNFLSDDTMFAGYVLPRPEGLGPGFLVAEGRGVRRYFPKTGDGEPVQHFVAEGVWAERLRFRGRPERNDVLTDRVYQDYAAKLLPRAVGYSAALLDYFFRGRLGAELYFDRQAVRLRIRNLTPEAMAGVFELHTVRGGEQRLVATFGSESAPVALGPYGVTVVTVPPGSVGGRRFALVFRGRLGDEEPSEALGLPGAVAAVVFEVDYVFTVQETFFGPMAGTGCEPETPRPDAMLIRRELFVCLWLPKTVRMEGRFVTNSERPVIARIGLSGSASLATLPTLIVDGQVQAGGEWVRQDPDGPDPRTFVITQAGIDIPPFYELEVTTVSGMSFDTRLAVFSIGGGTRARSIAKDDLTSEKDAAFLVEATKHTFLSLNVEDSSWDWREAQFRVVEISGSPYPRTPALRRFGPIRPTNSWLEIPEGVWTGAKSYEHQVIEFWDIVPDKALAVAAYEALPAPDSLADPAAARDPAVSWRAAVVRDYRPVELDFFRLIGVEPLFYTIVMAGD